MSEHCDVVFVDDEPTIRRVVEQWLSLADLRVVACASAAAALPYLDAEFPGVLVTDVRMRPTDGLALMREALARDHDLPVVLVTGHGDVGMAVEAMREGAYDFIEKPFEPEDLVEVVRRACEKRRLVLEVRRLREHLEARRGIEARLAGGSPAMERLRRDIAQLAGTRVDVLVHGETGCGKEQVARCLHENGPRARHRLVAINCGAIPEGLFESEILGSAPGAFTGATRRRTGQIAHAHQGTVFLDEVESLPLGLQVKLLRVLEEREVQALGTNERVAVDFRVVAATKVDLRQAAGAGEFRADLYYRLSVVELHVPPLRERPEDIPLLFELFSSRAARAHGLSPPALSAADLQALLAHPWPGNVRELKNIAERHVLASALGGRGIAELLGMHGAPPAGQEHRGAGSLSAQVESFERWVIQQALIRSRGSLKDAMAELGLPRRTLTEKLVRHGLRRSDFLPRGE